MADNDWLPGLPPGDYYPGMEDDFEVRYAPMAVWHRRKPPPNRPMENPDVAT